MDTMERTDVLDRLLDGQPISRQEACELIESGDVDEHQLTCGQKDGRWVVWMG